MNKNIAITFNLKIFIKQSLKSLFLFIDYLKMFSDGARYIKKSKDEKFEL